MITTPPLPSWRSLAAGFCGKAPDDAALAAPWFGPLGGGGLGGSGWLRAFWFSHSAFAMQAIVDWLAALRGGPLPCLWLPDYFCNQATCPARSIGARIFFYPVDDSLVPQWNQCRRLAASAPPDLFVLVHYFGQPSDGQAAKDFCLRQGALLIEDAAHVLLPIKGVGETGDFIFYSPHKLLAIPHGSLLLVRNENAARTMADAFPDASSRHSGVASWLAKRFLQKTLPDGLLAWQARLRQPGFFDDPKHDPKPPAPRLSAMARRMLAVTFDSLAAVAQARRDNWQALACTLGGLDGCHPLAISADAAPYRLALKCDDTDRAAALFYNFQRRGCPAESWPDLADEVLAAPGLHQAAIHMRRTILLLPVHQTASAAGLVHRCGGKSP